MTVTARVVTLALPFPPKALSPNFRPRHWAEKSTAVADYRALCRTEALNARREYEAEGVSFPFVGSVTVIVTFVLKSLSEKRDMDNLIAAFKPGQDGAFKDAGILRDDSIQVIERIGYEVAQGSAPGVRVRIQEAGE